MVGNKAFTGIFGKPPIAVFRAVGKMDEGFAKGLLRHRHAAVRSPAFRRFLRCFLFQDRLKAELRTINASVLYRRIHAKSLPTAAIDRLLGNHVVHEDVSCRHRDSVDNLALQRQCDLGY